MLDLDAIRLRTKNQFMACGPDGEFFAKQDIAALIAEVEALRGEAEPTPGF